MKCTFTAHTSFPVAGGHTDSQAFSEVESSWRLGSVHNRRATWGPRGVSETMGSQQGLCSVLDTRQWPAHSHREEPMGSPHVSPRVYRYVEQTHLRRCRCPTPSSMRIDHQHRHCITIATQTLQIPNAHEASSPGGDPTVGQSPMT